jgi:hypothetical protein
MSDRTFARVFIALVNVLLALVCVGVYLQREIERMEGGATEAAEVEEDAARFAPPTNRHYSRACITCETVVRDDAGNIIEILPAE